MSSIHWNGSSNQKVIASNNLNNSFTNYITSSCYEPRESIKTISSAMDVGDPSNFIRVANFLNDHDSVKKVIDAYSFNDEDTKIAIADLYEKYNYICDPHGAVGYLGVKKHKLLNKDFPIFFLRQPISQSLWMRQEIALKPLSVTQTKLKNFY